jgi:serine/threonine-protein kinase RsbW
VADDVPTILALAAPLSPAALDQVHDLVEQLFDGAAVDDMVDRIRFETAVIEVAGNILQHSQRTDPPGLEPRTFDLVLRGDSGHLTAEFRDDGRPVAIDFEQIAMPGEDAESGRGLALALASVDEITHERRDAMNVWRLTCLRRA